MCQKEASTSSKIKEYFPAQAILRGTDLCEKLLCQGPRGQKSCILRDAFQLMPEHLNFIRALQGPGTESTE